MEKLNIEVAMKAKQVLHKFTLDEVRDVSAGGGTFYVWVNCNSAFNDTICRSPIKSDIYILGKSMEF